jgi:hypothetical protein
MTRVCSWCGKYLGEKCPECSSIDIGLVYGDALAGFPVTSQCRGCGHEFHAGAGGTTSTACDDCAARLKEGGADSAPVPESEAKIGNSR